MVIELITGGRGLNRLCLPRRERINVTSAAIIRALRGTDSSPTALRAEEKGASEIVSN
jgi:hypothetical protein